MPSPGAGVLRKILRKAGETVTVGEVIAEIEPAAREAAAAPTPAAAPAAAPARRQRDRRRGRSRAAPGAERAAALPRPTADASLRAGPSARRLLAETGLPPTEVKGTGRGGRISTQDVVRALEERERRATPAARRRADGRAAPPPAPVTGARRARASASSRCRRCARPSPRGWSRPSTTAAILTTFNEVDMTEVLALRERYQERFLKQHGVKLGFMSFFVKAAIEALRAFPAVNAEIRGTDIVYKDHYDIGVAVGGGKGLVVPVRARRRPAVVRRDREDHRRAGRARARQQADA